MIIDVDDSIFKDDDCNYYFKIHEEADERGRVHVVGMTYYFPNEFADIPYILIKETHNTKTFKIISRDSFGLDHYYEIIKKFEGKNLVTISYTEIVADL